MYKDERQNTPQVITAIVAAYTVLWTLVPHRTLYYGVVWFCIWITADTELRDFRIPSVAIIQAIFYKAFSPLVAVCASIIILITSVTSESNAKVLKVYPLVVLCLYSNYILAN